MYYLTSCYRTILVPVASGSKRAAQGAFRMVRGHAKQQAQEKNAAKQARNRSNMVNLGSSMVVFVCFSGPKPWFHVISVAERAEDGCFQRDS